MFYIQSILCAIENKIRFHIKYFVLSNVYSNGFFFFLVSYTSTPKQRINHLHYRYLSNLFGDISYFFGGAFHAFRLEENQYRDRLVCMFFVFTLFMQIKQITF